MAWYAVATALFSEATAHGIMIRNQIPTQPSGNGPVPGPATLSAEGGIGLVNFTFAAPDGLTFTILGRLVGEPDFAEIAVGLTGPTHTQTSLAPGQYEFKVVPQNLEGDGPASEVVTVEVT